MSFQYPRGCTSRMLVVFLSDFSHNFRKSKLCLFMNIKSEISTTWKRISKYHCSFLQQIREHRHIEILCWWNQLDKFRYLNKDCYYRDSVKRESIELIRKDLWHLKNGIQKLFSEASKVDKFLGLYCEAFTSIAR